MAAGFDPYEILGVGRDATLEQIRAAYREKVARYHPDKHRGNPLEELAAAKLVEINRAWEMLSGARVRSTAKRAAPPASAGTKLVRTVGLFVALLFFLRFGLVLGRELIVIVRAFVLGVLFVVRMSPVLGVAVVMAIALGAGYFLRSRKGHG